MGQQPGAKIVRERIDAAGGNVVEVVSKDSKRRVWATWAVARQYAEDAVRLYGHKASPEFVKWAGQIPATPPTMDPELATLGQFMAKWFPPAKVA